MYRLQHRVAVTACWLHRQKVFSLNPATFSQRLLNWYDISGRKTLPCKILLPHLSDLRTEEFWVIFLNQKNQLIKKTQISKGGISATHVDVRVLFKEALENFSTNIIVAHNHPTGVLKPSEADIRMTKNIQNAGEILDIKLLDHIIIGENSFYSFAEAGLL